MGVRGLKTFIEKNDDLLIRDYRLYNTFVIIDACNLIGALIKQSQKHERRDLFGGDMVQFGQFVSKFFDNLKRCNIKPIIVFDGAQTKDINKSKTREKQRRAFERFQNVMSVNKYGFGDFILPATATNVFRSIAVDKDLKIIQCMYEADSEVARLSRKFMSPVISNDSDFYLIDLPYGLIPTDLVEHQNVKHSSKWQDTENRYDDCDDSYHFITCCIFYQDNFTKYFPNLDKKSLPLLGILAGNDFVKARVFEKICSQLPLQRISEIYGLNTKQFRKMSSKQHVKIIKILYYLCGRSLNETINQICLRVPKEERKDLKNLIKSNLAVYEVPSMDDFEVEFNKLYSAGFYSTYKQTFSNEDLLKTEFRKTSHIIMMWLKNSMEKSVLSYRCLELAQRNIVFVQSHMDDPQLPSAHLCQNRCMRVMLRLLRSSLQDNKPCVVYDRVSNSYGKSFINPMGNLEKFGPLNYLIYDVPKLSEDVRRNILLATFHSSTNEFAEEVVDYYNWFDSNHAEEFMTIKLLMNFIDLEAGKVKLWRHFRQATLLCMIYYYLKNKSDITLPVKLNEMGGTNFIEELLLVVKQYHYNKMPTLGKKRLYNCRLMHQITQLQTSIISFNFLNAFLGDIMARIRSEGWLNSCLLYNLAENLHNKRLALPGMPSLVTYLP